MTPDPEEDEAEAPEDAIDPGLPVDDPEVLRAKAAERDEFLDRLKRSMAEFQNYKTRVSREKTDLRKFVLAEVIRSMLPVIDNLERAAAAATEDDSTPLVAGVRMVIGEFQRVLDQHGVKAVQTEHAKFDPSQMEAVARIETDEADENAVLEVFEKGYRLDDFVIRPARVSVAAAKKPD